MLIESFCKHLKYERRIVLVTNGTGQLDPDNIDEIATKLQKEGIHLTILGVDFDDPEYGSKEEDKPPAKAENEKVLRELVAKSGGTFGTLQEAIDELATPRIKSVRPVTTFKGDLCLGSASQYEIAMTIAVERYPKVMRRTVPSATSVVIRAAPSQNEVGNDVAGVRSSYQYAVKDPSQAGGVKLVEREELAKGYEYGRTAVHISETDQNITKFETSASYEILGFVPVEKIERYTLLESSSVLMAQKGDSKAALALSSLAHALFELDSCAIARLVKKDMTEPQLNVLSPLIEADFEGLIENRLPYAEDVRSYRFPPLDKVLTVSGKSISEHRYLPNKQLANAMDSFVDSMILADDDCVMEDAFSPVLHHLEDSVRFRAVHPGKPLPPVSDVLSRFSHPPEPLLEKSQKALQALISAADVKKVPPKTKGRRRYREAEKPLSGLDVEQLFRKEGDAQQSISPDNSIPEFKRMLASSDNMDTIKAAVGQMGSIVEDRITKSFADMGYQRALEEIGVLRQELIEFEEPKLYNDLLRSLKKKILSGELGGNRRDFWILLKLSKVGLIDKKASSVSDVSPEEADEFMIAKL